MKLKSTGITIISSAIIWGAVIVGCAFKLRGTGYYDDISLILYGGACCHFILVWPLIEDHIKKNKKEELNQGN